VVFLFHSFAQITLNNIVNNGHDLLNPHHGGVVFNKSFSFCDLRNNWWGTPQGPNINISLYSSENIIQLRKVNNSDTILFTGIGLACLRPWLSEPVPDAGRPT
jgi:hypothetical protein